MYWGMLCRLCPKVTGALPRSYSLTFFAAVLPILTQALDLVYTSFYLRANLIYCCPCPAHAWRMARRFKVIRVVITTTRPRMRQAAAHVPAKPEKRAKANAPSVSVLVQRPCAFCGCHGKIEDNVTKKKKACPVCQGSGIARVPSNARPCASCKGGGRVRRGQNFTQCGTCKGTGWAA